MNGRPLNFKESRKVLVKRVPERGWSVRNADGVALPYGMNNAQYQALVKYWQEVDSTMTLEQWADWIEAGKILSDGTFAPVPTDNGTTAFDFNLNTHLANQGGNGGSVEEPKPNNTKKLLIVAAVIVVLFLIFKEK